MALVEMGPMLTPVATSGPPRTVETFQYVDLSSVDAASKQITSVTMTLTADAPSRARQHLRADDVLVATVRPNLNSVALVPSSLDGSIGSTGFAVLRSDPHRLDPHYLFHWVRTPQFVGDMTRVATGASYPAVSDRIVKASRIPLPPLPEQRRIAATLDQADWLRVARLQSLESSQRVQSAEFSRLFGDVVRNDRNWRMGTVGDLVRGFTTGKSVTGPDSAGQPDRPRVLKISSVTGGSFDPSESKSLPAGYEPPSSHFVAQGDLLISRANTAELVGATALVIDDPGPTVLPDKIWKFQWFLDDRAQPSFVWKMFSRPEFRRRLSEIATGSGGSMKNISQEAVLRLPAIIPPAHLQAEFTSKLERLERLSQAQHRHLATLDELFASLQHRAFNGEL